jgi:beta-lactamase superfamily II metal-dependent hydrolase
MVSIIIELVNAEKKYLFTGDAGIQSFKAIPDWQNNLKDLHWLKIPHHGSDNNISCEIIDVMRPEYADNSGDKYQDNYVLDCISKNQRSRKQPRSTKSGDLEYIIS